MKTKSVIQLTAITRVAALITLGLNIVFVPLAASSGVPSQSRLHRLFHSSAYNWSGYAAAANLQQPQAGSATDVKGSWTVPTLNCTQNGYASTWVGLDGYNSPTVEQIGIESDCSGGRASYYAWTEMYPFPAHLLTTNIHAGDIITAEVKTVGSSSFQLSLSNVSTHRSYSTRRSLRGAVRSSAEWIVEAPSDFSGHVLPLANFGQVSFSAASATIDHQSGSISSFSHDPLTMVNASLQAISVPSALSPDGSSFSVAYQ